MVRMSIYFILSSPPCLPSLPIRKKFVNGWELANYVQNHKCSNLCSTMLMPHESRTLLSWKIRQSQTLRCERHRRVRTCGVKGTAESDSAVWKAPQSRTPRCERYRRVKISSLILEADNSLLWPCCSSNSKDTTEVHPSKSMGDLWKTGSTVLKN
jgi:hypothetical protein